MKKNNIFVNTENKLHFEKFRLEHLGNDGNCPDAYATTELIKLAIENHTYKLYNGGGYEQGTTEPIELYDVVVWFSFGGDPYFQVCIENDEGDCCTLINSNNRGDILKTIK